MKISADTLRFGNSKSLIKGFQVKPLRAGLSSVWSPMITRAENFTSFVSSSEISVMIAGLLAKTDSLVDIIACSISSGHELEVKNRGKVPKGL